MLITTLHIKAAEHLYTVNTDNKRVNSPITYRQPSTWEVPPHPRILSIHRVNQSWTVEDCRIYNWKVCISGPAQFKSILSKGQLYNLWERLTDKEISWKFIYSQLLNKWTHLTSHFRCSFCSLNIKHFGIKLHSFPFYFIFQILFIFLLWNKNITVWNLLGNSLIYILFYMFPETTERKYF